MIVNSKPTFANVFAPARERGEKQPLPRQEQITLQVRDEMFASRVPVETDHCAHGAKNIVEYCRYPLPDSLAIPILIQQQSAKQVAGRGALCGGVLAGVLLATNAAYSLLVQASPLITRLPGLHSFIVNYDISFFAQHALQVAATAFFPTLGHICNQLIGRPRDQFREIFGDRADEARAEVDERLAALKRDDCDIVTH